MRSRITTIRPTMMMRPILWSVLLLLLLAWQDHGIIIVASKTTSDPSSSSSSSSSRQGINSSRIIRHQYQGVDVWRLTSRGGTVHDQEHSTIKQDDQDHVDAVESTEHTPLSSRQHRKTVEGRTSQTRMLGNNEYYIDDDNTNIGISTVGKGNGGSSGGKGGESGSSSEEDNVFYHDDAVSSPVSSPTYHYGKSSKSAKRSKGESGKGKGKGSSTSTDDYYYDDDDNEYNDHDPAPSPSADHPMPTSESEPTSSEDGDNDGSNGGSNGGDDDDDEDEDGNDNDGGGDDDDDDDDDNGSTNGDDDDDDENRNGDDDDDDDDEDTGEEDRDGADEGDQNDDNGEGDGVDDTNDGDDDDDNDEDNEDEDNNDGIDRDDNDDVAPGGPPSNPTTPVESPTPPSGNPPVVTQPSERNPSPPSDAPTNAPDSSPTVGGDDEGLPPTPGSPRCQLAGNGLFGADVGLAQELGYQYQTLVIPSVSVAELNIDMLSSVEERMGEDILTRIFQQCREDSSIVESLARSDNSRKRALDASTNQHSTFGYRRKHSFLRYLQAGDGAIPLDGLSIRPRDTVIEGLECVDVEPVYPCFVIQGLITLFSATKLDEATIEQVQTAIRQSIEAGNLQDSDNRFLGVSWKGFDDPPSDENNNEGDDESGETDGSDGTDDVGTQAPTNTESQVSPSQDSNGSLEPWAISVIVIGGVIICAMVYLCLRGPSNNNRQRLGEDDGGDFSEFEQDGYKDEVDQTGPKLVPVMPVNYPSTRDSIQAAEEQPNQEEEDEEEVVVEEQSIQDEEEEEEEEEEEFEESYADPENSHNERSSHTELHDQSTTGRDIEDTEDVSTFVEDVSYDPSFDEPRSHQPMYDATTQDENYLKQSHMSLDVDKSNESYSAVTVSESDDLRVLQPAGQRRSAGGVADEASSAYSSYEEVVEEDEYEIEYTEGSDHQEGDRWEDEDADDKAETSLPFLAHNAQQGHTTSFESLRNKWERSGAR